MSNDPNTRVVQFLPDFYEVGSMADAMEITLTAEEGMTSAERFAKETPFLVDEIGRFLGVGPQTCVLDYGCGLGRISKALIEKYGCRAIGIDTSRAMRLLAPEYVLSERFVVWSPETLDKMIAKGFGVDCCVSLWVIQHAFDPLDVIGRMSRAVRPGGVLYVLNTANRCVPTDAGMVDDGFDIGGALRQAFVEEHSHPLPETVTTTHLAATTRIQVLRKSE